MNGISQEATALLDELQGRYISALDEKQLDAWVKTFSQVENASYICISAENVDRGHKIALMMDNTLARIKDRVIFATKVWPGTFHDYRTRHFSQRLRCEAAGENLYRVLSNFYILYTVDPDPTKALAAGVYKDLVEIKEGRASFKERLAIYDTTVLPQYVIYPF
jgi:3-phenylpropionate/cinnamic acid dioxygenase small subunit